jgi:hypothetical protein
MAVPSFTTLLPVLPAAAPIAVTSVDGKPYPGLKAKAISAGAAVIHGVNKQAKRGDNTAKYARLIGDGSTTEFTESDAACLANADLQATAGLAAANSLRVVVTVDGTPLIRIGSDDTLAAGEFLVKDDSGTVLEFQAAPAAGAVIDVHIADAADIVTYDAQTADVVAERDVLDYMGASVAVSNLYNC